MNPLISVLGPFIVLVMLFSVPISLFTIIYYLSNIKVKERVNRSSFQIQKDILIKKLKTYHINSDEYKLLSRKLLWLKERYNEQTRNY